MADSKRTAEPWIAQHRGTSKDIILGRDHFRVGTELEVADPDAVCIHVYGARKAEKAAHIVECVNAHDDLVEALEALLKLNDDSGPFGGELYQDRVDRAWENARAVIAKARGETHA